MYKLSICIPTYNRVATLKETLDSVLPQIEGRNDIEIYISDNASTDCTEALIVDFMERYPCIRYNRNSENVGFDRNVIACVEQANGEYISFISDDDIVPAGTFHRLEYEISKYDPSIIYLNHHPFLCDNPQKKMPCFLPHEDRLFSEGKEFFQFCGLGFLSALTLKTKYARELVNRVKHELLNQPHLGFAARIALSQMGPFIFLGTISIGGRVPSILEDDYVTNHAINVDKLYINLNDEGLLDKASLDLHMKASIRSLSRKILYNKCVGNYKTLIDREIDILEMYGRYIAYYFYVLPFLLMPRRLLMPPYLMLRYMSSFIKYFKYG